MEDELKYTFTVTQTIEVRVTKGEGADERAMEKAREKIGQYIYWNDVTKTDIEETA